MTSSKLSAAPARTAASHAFAQQTRGQAQRARLEPRGDSVFLLVVTARGAEQTCSPVGVTAGRRDRDGPQTLLRHGHDTSSPRQRASSAWNARRAAPRSTGPATSGSRNCRARASGEMANRAALPAGRRARGTRRRRRGRRWTHEGRRRAVHLGDVVHVAAPLQQGERPGRLAPAALRSWAARAPVYPLLPAIDQSSCAGGRPLQRLVGERLGGVEPAEMSRFVNGACLEHLREKPGVAEPPRDGLGLSRDGRCSATRPIGHRPRT